MSTDDHREIYERLRTIERDLAVQGEQIKGLVATSAALAETVKPLAQALSKGRGFAAAFWFLWSIVPAAAGAMTTYLLTR